jgi:hypothetical protein
VGCLPMVKPGAVNNNAWGSVVTEVGPFQVLPVVGAVLIKGEGPMFLMGQGESCLRRARTGNEGTSSVGLKTLVPLLTVGGRCP